MVTTLPAGAKQQDPELLKGQPHDKNCVGIALGKCLGSPQGPIVAYLITKGLIANAKGLEHEGVIANICAHFGWPKELPKGDTWDKTRTHLMGDLVPGQKWFSVNWGNRTSEGFGANSTFHAFTIEVGQSTTRSGPHSLLHIKGGNIDDYHGVLKETDWVTLWKVQ
jgi:hypothetical protein